MYWIPYMEHHGAAFQRSHQAPLRSFQGICPFRLDVEAHLQHLDMSALCTDSDFHRGLEFQIRVVRKMGV